MFVGAALLWPCVAIWGYAPKPHARGLARNLILLEMKLWKKEGRYPKLRLGKKRISEKAPFIRSFIFKDKEIPRQASRAGLGA